MTVQKWYVLGGFGYHGNLLVFFGFWFLVRRVSIFVRRYSRSGLECPGCSNQNLNYKGPPNLFKREPSEHVGGRPLPLPDSAALSARAHLSIIAFSAVGWSNLSNFSLVAVIWRSHLLPSLFVQVVEAHRLTLAPREEIQRLFCCCTLRWSVWLCIANSSFAFSAVYCLNQHEGPPGTLFFVPSFGRCPLLVVSAIAFVNATTCCAGYLVVALSSSHRLLGVDLFITNNIDASFYARGPHTHQDAQLKRRLHVELGTNKLVKEPCP